MKTLDYANLISLLETYDVRAAYGPKARLKDPTDLREKLESAAGMGTPSNMSVLGIDIYKYSHFKSLPQTLVPILFRILYEETLDSCMESFAFIFQQFKQYTAFSSTFIDTGDGGFQLLPTPVHAILFATMFEFNLRAYNAGRYLPKFRQIVGHLEVRYTASFGDVYCIADKYYGAGIIDCARIIARDKLNRFLIDGATHSWFLENLDGIENLQTTTLGDLAHIPEFSQYGTDSIGQGNNILIGETHAVNLEPSLRRLDVLKIGSKTFKDRELEVYGIHLQVTLKVSRSGTAGPSSIITVTIGNLNTKGI